jgi:hypothetical protein
MNDLTNEKRYKLKMGVILLVLIFLVVYGTLMFLKYTQSHQDKTQVKANGQVIFEQPKLKFFNYKVQLNTYPDRIAIHYPYLVVVRPDEFRSEIYNMETKRKEKDIHEVNLDYFNGIIVYNKQGYQTYFNDKNLGLLCDQAFLKSKTEIFCITRPDQNKQENKLIAINPQTLEKKDVYTSQNVLTAVAYYKGTLYIGEYNFEKNKAYIAVNGTTVPIGDLVNVIYPMDNNIYAASFKSMRNKQVERYYEIINQNGKLLAKPQDTKKIVFY